MHASFARDPKKAGACVWGRRHRSWNNLSLPIVSSYKHYTDQAFTKCLQVINKDLPMAGNSAATDETLEMAIKAMSGEFVSLPKYR